MNMQGPDYEHDLSPLSEVPRITGDEVDDARLIARLHQAIAQETGPFALPWYHTTWARSLMVTSALLVASVVGLQIGKQLGPTNPDRDITTQDSAVAVLFRQYDRAYDEAGDPEYYLQSLDAALGSIGVRQESSEADGLLVNDPAYRMVLISEPQTYQM